MERASDNYAFVRRVIKMKRTSVNYTFTESLPSLMTKQFSIKSVWQHLHTQDSVFQKFTCVQANCLIQFLPKCRMVCPWETNTSKICFVNFVCHVQWASNQSEKWKILDLSWINCVNKYEQIYDHIQKRLPDESSKSALVGTWKNCSGEKISRFERFLIQSTSNEAKTKMHRWIQIFE